MGECVLLVNYTRREHIGVHLPFAKPGEWVGHVAGAAMTTWYLLRQRGDDVRFVGDYGEASEHLRVYREFTDVGERIVAAMVEEGILADCGRSYQDDEDPHVYIRDIRPKRGCFWPRAEDWP
jgi:hypothetical protein